MGYWIQLQPQPRNTINVQRTEMTSIESRNRNLFEPIHTPLGPSTYKCPNCSRFYLRMSCLKRHMRVECGKAPKYQCRICQGWFKYKHNMTAHMKLHFEEPKYHCDVCLKKFYRRDRLVEHQKRLHKIFPVT
ncbi:PREDICTED: zinc finger protein 548-like [Dufourea novaeangliae]|uniref:zinc finger protein 548-like n=1 Tax=Dufourea novaeangliae TaxID=178035 RepID=UPI000767DC33|nr:PREDICTED: zinc finger protein 548-like [Dufourea novaeangliae]